MKVLVIGANGLIGSTVFRTLSDDKGLDVKATIRQSALRGIFSPDLACKLVSGIDIEVDSHIVSLLSQFRPDVVINCAGITKHKSDAENPLVALPINALFPHKLASYCELINARLIHISTDCVFSGERGNYTEEDTTDANDVYGKAKALGEVSSGNALTLRTSTIGHELNSEYGLLNWFLSQGSSCKGYTNAIFSGLPTVVLAHLIRDVVIPNTALSGLYNVAAAPINKYELLKLIADQYGKEIEIQPDDQLIIDRSLNGERFEKATGYVAPDWPELIKLMHHYQ